MQITHGLLNFERGIASYFALGTNSTQMDLQYRNDTLYATKAIAVILSEPFVHSASQVLAAMHKYACKGDFELQTLEGAINNVLHDVPIPSPGRGVRGAIQ